jgi:pimeloyl-ACP methyl ester carboxylesterase
MSSITHGYANVNGVRLHYAEAGSGDNFVILIHGFPEFWYSWRHQLVALGKHFHVIAPDMRGYNLSDKPPRVDDYRIEVLVDDVVGLMDRFGAKSAAIVGHDWGASVAWMLAEKHPQRVSKLAVMQVPPPAVWRQNMSVGQFFRSWYMLLFQLPRVPEWALSRNNMAAIDRTFTESVGRKGSFNAADIEKYKEALRQPGAITAAVNYYRANVKRLLRRSRIMRDPEAGESTRERSRFSMPTMFFFGEKDFAIAPQSVAGMDNYFDGPFTEVRIPDSGHWIQNEAPEEVNARLIDFLKSD